MPSPALAAEEFGAGPRGLFLSTTLLALALDAFPYELNLSGMVLKIYRRKIEQVLIRQVEGGFVSYGDKLDSFPQIAYSAKGRREVRIASDHNRDIHDSRKHGVAH